METRASRRRKLLLKEAVEDNEDRISNLPDAILHYILSFLPVKSIAQTSLLSKRWDYLWTTLPCLDFSEFSITESHQRDTKAMELIITTVLARRPANFNIKVFRFKGHLGFPCLRDCIRRVVRHSVKELELDVSLGSEFNLPRCVVDCDSLTSLTLKTHYPDSWCGVRNSWFKFCSYNVTGSTSGLRSLQALTLKHVRFIDRDSAALFSGSSSFPILKRLALKCCKGMTHLNIGCPELEYLEVEGTKINGLDISGGERLKTLRVICSFRALKNESWVKIFAPKLETFCWEHNEIPEKYSVQSFPFLKNCCIETTFKYRFTINAAINFLSGVVSARYLRIHILHAVKILSTVYFEGGLPFPFLNLRTLEVRTGRLSKIEIPAIVCLLKNAPLLDTLKLEISYSPSSTGGDKKWGITLLDNSGCTEEQFWESEAQALRSFLDHLRVLRIHVHFSMSESVIIATRFLLKHGNALQEVTLRSNPHEWKEEFIIGFLWASPHIKISID